MYDFLLCAKDIDIDSISTIVLLDLGTVVLIFDRDVYMLIHTCVHMYLICILIFY